MPELRNNRAAIGSSIAGPPVSGRLAGPAEGLALSTEALAEVLARSGALSDALAAEALADAAEGTFPVPPPFVKPPVVPPPFVLPSVEPLVAPPPFVRVPPPDPLFVPPVVPLVLVSLLVLVSPVPVPTPLSPPVPVPVPVELLFGLPPVPPGGAASAITLKAPNINRAIRARTKAIV